MARRKRSSDSITRADNRYAGLVSIDASPDLGNGFTLTACKTAAADTKSALATYNSKLSGLDSLLNVLEAREAALDELSVRMLAAVGVKFGKDINEYEQAGGTRSSERKAPERKARTPALVPA